MKISEFTNIPLKIKNEDDGMQLLVQEYEVTREMYKGRHPVTSKYVTIFVPHSIGQADSDIVSAAIADYHERGYSVNVMHSGSEPLKDCICDLLHNNAIQNRQMKWCIPRKGVQINDYSNSRIRICPEH